MIHERSSGRHRACRKESKPGLKRATLMNNKSMNSKEINSHLNGSNLMNNNYRIESNNGLKASTLRNNKSMNNKYRITIKDTPVQNTSKTRNPAHAQVDMFVRN